MLFRVNSSGHVWKLGLPPDRYQGFGRIKLSTVLNIAGSCSLWVKDNVSLSEGDSHVFKFTVPRVDSGNSPFKVSRIALSGLKVLR